MYSTPLSTRIATIASETFMEPDSPLLLTALTAYPSPVGMGEGRNTKTFCSPLPFSWERG
jgi:hypothetical protein